MGQDYKNNFMNNFIIYKKEFVDGKTLCNVDFTYGASSHTENHIYVFSGELSDEALNSALEEVLQHYNEEAKLIGL